MHFVLTFKLCLYVEIRNWDFEKGRRFPDGNNIEIQNLNQFLTYDLSAGIRDYRVELIAEQNAVFFFF
jgi:hypothetical protein